MLSRIIFYVLLTCGPVFVFAAFPVTAHFDLDRDGDVDDRDLSSFISIQSAYSAEDFAPQVWYNFYRIAGDSYPKNALRLFNEYVTPIQ